MTGAINFIQIIMGRGAGTKNKDGHGAGGKRENFGRKPKIIVGHTSISSYFNSTDKALTTTLTTKK